jgi:hypothetical protein
MSLCRMGTLNDSRCPYIGRRRQRTATVDPDWPRTRQARGKATPAPLPDGMRRLVLPRRRARPSA